MTLRGIIAGLTLLLLTAAASSAYAQGKRDNDRRADDRDGKWEQLGCEEVGRRTDTDVIKVGRREGRFSAIRLEAKGNDVNILELKVVYANGDPDDIRVRSEIREGTETRPLDLKGRDRAIDRIEITSKRDFKGRGRGKASICVYGLEAERDRRADDRDGKWEELGCQSVGFLTDRDIVKVGRREGRFKAIKLSVSGNSVYISDLKVVYSKGGADDLRVRSEIKAGDETRPLDLKGRERSIDHVELVYRSKPSFKGRAKVCVSGLQ
jgi:hypothetical protein